MKLETKLGLSEEIQRVEYYLQTYMPTQPKGDKTGEIMASVASTKGKRCRPMLMLLAGQCGREYEKAKDRLCQLGALTEMVHMASLIHDDIVDDSLMRRGQLTVQHRFGKDMAVYSGDLLLGRVLQTMFKENMARAGMLLGETVEEMCRGEINQYNCRYRLDTRVEDYMHNIYGKTVSLFEYACHVGALEGGCSETQVAALRSYGTHLGYLFQIRDDLLDFLSDSLHEGKTTHMDFQEGVFTLPVLLAFQNKAYQQEIRELALTAYNGPMSAKNRLNLENCIRKSGALNQTMAQMNQHVLMAKEALTQLPEGRNIKALKALLDLLSLPQDTRKRVGA